MNDKEMSEGLCPVGQIFWRVEVEDKDISPGLKEIVEKIIRERKSISAISLILEFIQNEYCESIFTVSCKCIKE